MKVKYRIINMIIDIFFFVCFGIYLYNFKLLKKNFKIKKDFLIGK